MKPLECVNLIQHLMDMGIYNYLIEIKGVYQKSSFKLEIQLWDKKGSVVAESLDEELIRLIGHHFRRRKYAVTEDTPTNIRIHRRS